MTQMTQASDMPQVINTLCKALGQLLHLHHKVFDRETSDLMRALAAYVEKNQ